MGYDILGQHGSYWRCNDSTWRHYLALATAFGWAPEGAFWKDDEGGFGPHPTGSYLDNEWQLVTDEDAREFAAALNLAIGIVNSGSRMTADQARALKQFEITNGGPYGPYAGYDPKERAYMADLAEKYRAEHPHAVRHITTSLGAFLVDTGKISDLAELAALGGFTIS